MSFNKYDFNGNMFQPPSITTFLAGVIVGVIFGFALCTLLLAQGG